MSTVETENRNIEELLHSLREIGIAEDRLERVKEVENIKSEFYKLLSKLKAEAEAAGENVQEKFAEAEESFKSLYSDYKKERAVYAREQETARAENLKLKKAVIEDLKTLVEGLDDVDSAFPAFRDIQARWKEIGPVPAPEFRDLNDTYQHQVELFYDMVKINHDLRDLDFKKNLEAKEDLCAQAETLAESDDIVGAFNVLQKLHEQWKDFGPVAKEFRESIWERFKAATTVINKRYQAHFEEMKANFEANLKAKEALCEEVEAIVAREDIADAAEWNACSKQIENIQARWKEIGFASRKDNQKIYDRLRAACDAFFARKRSFFLEAKGETESNVAKKEELIRLAEELKSSTDWKKATDQFISLQKQWKEIGGIPRKKSEQLWKRFRAACDEFFAERDKQAKPENDFYSNLKAKKALIAEIKAFKPTEELPAEKAAEQFAEKFRAIGHVPFKEKDKIAAAYKEAFAAAFPNYGSQKKGGERRQAAPVSPKTELIRKYNSLQQEISTYENNIGFFAMSKGAAALVQQMQDKIDKAKAELGKLEAEIRKFQEEEENQ